jgi:hypothetical protein
MKKKSEPTNQSSSSSTEKKKLVSKQIHIIGRDAIVLDEQQKAVAVPAIVEGPPGSGKTCVAYAMLEKLAERDQATKKVLYLTQSQNLAEKIRNLWQGSPFYRPDHQEGVHILSYRELLAELYPGLEFQNNASENLKKYLMETPGVISTKLKQKDRQDKSELMALEFRIISGFSDNNEYLNAGANVTLYPKDQRNAVLKAYLDWKVSWKNEHYQEFSPIVLPQDSPQKYDEVLVDEAQDLSHLQLMNLMNLARDFRLIYFIDPKQNLKDCDSKIVFLQNEFYKRKITVKPTRLESSYRCPPQIMALAKEVNQWRLSLLPNMKQEAEIMLSGIKKGEIAWLNTTDKEGFQSLENLKYDSDTYFVTDQENKIVLMSKGFSRVFTPEEIKGLQAKNIVLFQPLAADIFRKINNALGQGQEENTGYGPALCSLFTSISRAEERVFFYQNENASLKHLIDPLKKHETRRAAAVLFVQVDRDKSLRSAKELYLKGMLEQARATLKNEVFTNPDDCDRLMDEELKKWSSVQVAPPHKIVSPDPLKKNNAGISPDSSRVLREKEDGYTKIIRKLTASFGISPYKPDSFISLTNAAKDKSFIDFFSEGILNHTGPAHDLLFNLVAAYIKIFSEKSYESQELKVIKAFIFEVEPICSFYLAKEFYKSLEGREKDSISLDIAFNLFEFPAKLNCEEARCILVDILELKAERELNLSAHIGLIQDAREYAKVSGPSKSKRCEELSQIINQLISWNGKYYLMHTRIETVELSNALLQQTFTIGDGVLYLVLLARNSLRINWDYQDPDTGMSALLTVCQTRPKHYMEIVTKLLYEKNVDLTLRDKKGRSILVFLILLKVDIALINLVVSCPRFIFSTTYKAEPPTYQKAILDAVAKNPQLEHLITAVKADQKNHSPDWRPPRN